MQRNLNLYFRSGLLAVATLSAYCITTGSSLARQNPAGVWFDDTGKGAVQIYRCGNTSLCGKIVWLRQPLSSKTGKPLRDAYNPSPVKRRQPICGLVVIQGLRQQTDGSWDGGRIYDPKVGKSYDVAVDLIGRNQLRVTGYLGARFLGKSFIWTRASRRLPSCNAA